MSYYVYVIINDQKSKLTTYVGYTNNLKKRLLLHNKGKGAKFTRGRKWKLIYSEEYDTKKEALTREYYIKKNKKFRSLLKKNSNEKKDSNITSL
jgi:putative endonuclease